MKKYSWILLAALTFVGSSCTRKQAESDMLVRKIDSLTVRMGSISTMSEYIEIGRKGMFMIDEAASVENELNDEEEKKLREAADKFKQASSKAYERLGFTEESITNSIDETTRQSIDTLNNIGNGNESAE